MTCKNVRLHNKALAAAADRTYRARLLIVDDEFASAKMLSTVLERLEFSCALASSGKTALEAMARERFEVVVSDVRMPGMSGLELLVQTQQKFPHTVFILLTGIEDLAVAVEAMRSGADDYLVKPALEEAVVASVERALRKRRLERQLETYRVGLEALVQERTQQLEDSYEQTLQSLGAAIDLRDGETAGHSRRVCAYALEIARTMRISEKERSNLKRAAYLHDIGKLAIPDRILLKPGPLSEEEWVIMRTHVQLGFELLKGIPFLAEPAEIVLAHHEHFDGGGYPRRLTREQIPMGARIFAIGDAFDAITSHRPYRTASSFETARRLISEKAGSQFDPFIVKAFLGIPLSDWRRIADELGHTVLAHEAPDCVAS